MLKHLWGEKKKKKWREKEIKSWIPKQICTWWGASFSEEEWMLKAIKLTIGAEVIYLPFISR